MTTAQITLSEANSRKVRDLSERLGKTPDEVVSEAVEKFAAGAPAGEAAGENPRVRALGMYKGQVWMSEDFNAPLTDDELKEWGL
jgi:hypothetical protein